MNTPYFNHDALVEEAAHLSAATPPAASELTLSVPDKLRETFMREAFYCRTSQEEMPSRAILYGATIMSLMSKGAHIGFEYSPVSNYEELGRTPAVRRLPFNFAAPEDSAKISHACEMIREASDTEFDVHISPYSSALLQQRSQKNGLSDEVNFIAFAALVEYVGTAEREGLHLSVSPQLLYS